QPRALEMLEELDAEPCARRGAFDQARDVRNHEAAVVADTHHAELRMQRRERVVRYLRPRGRKRARERRLARVRRTEQPDIGEQLERELQMPRFARAAAPELARCAIHARLEAGIAATAVPALRDEQALTVARKVAQRFAGIEVADLRALRHLDQEVGARRAGHILPRAAAASLGAESTPHAEVGKRVHAFARYEIDAAAVAAVAAVRAAARDELLAAEAHAAVAAGASLHTDVRFVDKFHGRDRPAVATSADTKKPRKRGSLLAASRRAQSPTSTLTNRRCFGPLTAKSTRPAAPAYSV